MLPDVHPSVQPPVKCQQAFSITCKAVIWFAVAVSIRPAFPNFHVVSQMLPTVSILISLYVAAILLHYPGGRVHVRSSLAFLNSSAVPKPTLMNQLNLSNAQGPLPPLVVVFLLSKFLH
jgi:hypothetical protein